MTENTELENNLSEKQSDSKFIMSGNSDGEQSQPNTLAIIDASPPGVRDFIFCD